MNVPSDILSVQPHSNANAPFWQLAFSNTPPATISILGFCNAPDFWLLLQRIMGGSECNGMARGG